MSEDRLFKNADEQEKIYAPQQVPGEPQEQVAADEHSMTPRDRTEDHTPVAVGLGTGGSAAATPASDEFEPGMNREERDLRRGDTDVVGPDPSDQAGVERRRVR
ncbi:MAG TPA: hypothetical protein VFZ66_01475 [Herpetosiphonaceae bacterium]